MRPWPRSLVGRMSWLVAGVGVLSFVLHLAVMAQWLDGLSADVASAIAGRVAAAREMLLRAAPGERDTLAAQIGSSRFQVQRVIHAEPRDQPALMPLAGGLLTRMREELGPEVQVSLPLPGALGAPGEARFDLHIDGEPWRITHHLQPPVHGLLGTGLGWLLLVAVAVFASLALGVRFIARPISVLAERLRSQGNRLHALPLPAGGASELHALTEAFNRLAESVRQADEDRQHMLAGVSHDLRTPLARLKLRIETQLDSQASDELLRDVDAIERIVAQFLAYVQGEMQGAHTGLGQADTVQGVMRQVVAGYAMHGHAVQALASNVAAELPDLALQRMLANLIDNALAHGRPPVRVSLSQRAEGGVAHAVLAVSDAGAGMSEAEFQQARLPFVRLAGGQAGLGHCGLGLAIVSQLARQLGARLECQRDTEGRFGVALVWPMPAVAVRPGGQACTQSCALPVPEPAAPP